MNKPHPAHALVHGFRLDDRQVEPQRFRILRPDGESRVEPRAMDVLLTLACNAGETMTRNALVDAVWKHPHVTDEALSRCISLLRTALGDDRARPRFIETIPRRGYRLLMPPVLNGNSGLSAPSVVSVAVLPLLNLAGDPAEEHLADGLTELLISNLATMPSISVISRTSAMHYKGTRARLGEIARELDVERIVEGSVLRSGRELQVVIQLIDPITDRHLFARTYTRTLTDVLRLQNEVAWRLAEEIGATLGPPSFQAGPAAPVNEDAMRAWLLARHFWSQRTPDGFERAIREYEACLAHEPGFAPAHAGIADTLITQSLYGLVPPTRVAPRARAEAARALAADPEGPQALGASGGVALFFDWNLDGAARLLRRAIAANPSHDMARLGLADALIFGGDVDGGLRELHQALRVSPFDLGLHMNLGDFLLWARRHDESAAAFRRTLELGPHFWPARCGLAELLAWMAEGEAAKAELERASRDAPPPRIARSRALIHALLGERAEAQHWLARLDRTREERYLPATELARVHAVLGDADAAFTWIDRAIEERTPRLLQLGVSPAYDQIRGDPRFAERLSRVGLTRC